MAAIPQSPKGQSFLPKRGGVFALRSGHSARATKRLLSGIIDCAFEISEDGFRRYCASDYPLCEVFDLRSNPQYVEPGKIFPRTLFTKACLEISGGFQDE